MNAASAGGVSASASAGDLFDARTELGQAYRATDWTRTSLGVPDGWGDSLKSTVRLMLASRFAMWMGWGPDLTFFCNEAYRRDTLGGKFPWALGRPTAEVWSEIWDQLTDRITAVTVRGESTWDDRLRLFVRRNDYLEETFHTFSYSPLTAGDGAIVGLLCVVDEVTEAVVDARRVAAVSELSARLAAAATTVDVAVAAQAALSPFTDDVPFAAAYVDDHDGVCSHLAWSSGVEPGLSATPTTLDTRAGRHPWIADRLHETPELVAAPADALCDLPVDEQGARPEKVVSVPITRAGTDSDRLGSLVVALSPHRPWDEHYSRFIGLVASHYGAALARARAFEAERDQAVLIAAREHAIAAELQSSLLPARDFTADHLDIASLYAAGVEGTTVGGDWYDVIDLGPGRTALVVGDVMGRGVRAAAMMGQLRAAIRAYARLELSPGVVLGLLDETVRELGTNTIVTCVYAVYDPADHTLVYANAGHLPPLLSAPGRPTVQLDEGGPPLGIGRGWPTAQTVVLDLGSTLTLYTDGVVERRDADLGDGIAALCSCLDTAVAPLDELPQHLVDTVMPDGSDDDIAVLIARISDRARLDRSARHDYQHGRRRVGDAREFVMETLSDWLIPDDVVDDAQLIVSELVTNAFQHADSDVTLTVRLAGPRLFIEVHDDLPTSPQPRNAMPSDTNGRGLAIVATLSSRWGTRVTPSGKAVWCQLAVPELRSPPAG